jgi:hypothetical protein
VKLQNTSAIAEIVSSIAIVITLAYLAVQTSQTNEALRANSRQATMETEVSIILASLNHPDSASAPVAPSDVGAYRRMLLLAATARLREFSWYQYQNGILDEELWRTYARTTARLFGDEYGNQVWASFESELDPQFVAYMNNLIEERER